MDEQSGNRRTRIYRALRGTHSRDASGSFEATRSRVVRLVRAQLPHESGALLLLLARRRILWSSISPADALETLRPSGDRSACPGGDNGTLHAWNASDLTEIWNSNMRPADMLGEFAKFVSPLVANGRVYVPTFSNQLIIYGLHPPQDAVPLAPYVSSILNSASFIQGAVTPGEVLAILRTNLGPATLPER
jgi:hypothetical protein